MQLSVKDLANLLNITQRTIYKWIKEQKIPFYRIHDQYRFNRIEIMDWAATHKINCSQMIIQDSEESNTTLLSLTDSIKKGGIHYHVEGKDKKTLLRSVIDRFNLPEEVNKGNLLEAMLAREALGSTEFGDGIAIPHARYPVVTDIPHALVAVCFLKKPIDYDAINGKPPVNCLFALISPTVRSHLKMLSRIAYALKNPRLKEALVNQASHEVILSEIEKNEKSLDSSI